MHCKLNSMVSDGFVEGSRETLIAPRRVRSQVAPRENGGHGPALGS